MSQITPQNRRRRSKSALKVCPLDTKIFPQSIRDPLFRRAILQVPVSVKCGFMKRANVFPYFEPKSDIVVCELYLKRGKMYILTNQISLPQVTAFYPSLKFSNAGWFHFSHFIA